MSSVDCVYLLDILLHTHISYLRGFYAMQCPYISMAGISLFIFIISSKNTVCVFLRRSETKWYDDNFSFLFFRVVFVYFVKNLLSFVVYL